MALETINSFDDVVALAKRMYDLQKKKADETVPKIMKVKSLSAPAFNNNHLQVKSYYSTDYPTTVVGWNNRLTKLLAEYDAKEAELKADHEANAEAIANNTAIREKVSLLMRELGIPGSYSERDWKSKARMPKYNTVTAGYIGDLNRNVPITDGHEWAVRQLETNRQQAKDYVAKQVKLLEQKEREAAEAKAKEKAEMQLVHMRVKYDCDPGANAREILAAIIGKNKYLRLAHYMCENRNDWNEGCDYAEIGLDGFIPDSEEDEEIYACVSRACGEGWQGDGRVFRDMQYNYSYIYSLVEDEPLMKDYNTINDIYQKDR